VEALCHPAMLARGQAKSTCLLRLVALSLGACVLVGAGAAFMAVQHPCSVPQTLQGSFRRPWPGSRIHSDHSSQRLSLFSGLAVGLMVFSAVTLLARGRVGAVRHRALPQHSSALSLPTEVKAAPGDQEEQFRTLCTMLLRKVGQAEDILAKSENADGVLDFEGFEHLLPQLDFDCDTHQARALFDLMDHDGSGTIDVSEMKMTLRNSGVVESIYREGLQNTLYTVVPAVALAVGFGVVKGPSAGLDFATAYIVEDSLSVDNLFVFLAIFQYFKVPPDLQKTCLDLGIYGAVILRFFFIFAGLAAVQNFKPLLLVFAAVLLYASYIALADADDDDDEEEGPPPLIRDLLSYLPTTKNFVGDKLWIQDEKDGFLFTPLLTCIVALELSDILFAIDSVPAVFAVTSDSLIVYTSNILAILGLRSLYQVLSIAVQDLVYLETSAAVILGFVGLKLVGEVAGFELDSSISLIVIVGTLAIGITASKLEEDREQEAKKTKTKNSFSRLVDDAGKMFGW